MKKILILLLILFGLISSSYAINADEDLLAHFPFTTDENDISGNSRTVTSSGATFSSSGATLDGTNDYIKVDYFSNLSSTTITFAGYFKPTSWGSDAMHMMSRYGNTDTSPNFRADLFYCSNTGIDIRYYLDNSFFVDSAQSCVLNTEYFIVGTYDGTTAKLYIDGTLKQSGSGSRDTASTTAIYLGSRPELDVFYGEVVRDFSIWNKALNQSEITDLYNNGINYNSPTPTINSNETTGTWFNSQPTMTLNTTTNSNYSYIQNGGNETSIGNNINTTSFSPTLSYGSNNFTFISNDEYGQANSSYTYNYDNVFPTFNDTHPTIVSNATFNITEYLTYTEDNVASCIYTLSNGANYTHNCTDTVNITTFDTYNYNMTVVDLAGNSNTTTGSFLFDILASIYIKDEDYNTTLSNTELNITGTNFSDYTYSNPYQEWISNLGSSINYSFTDSSGQTVDETGSINFSTTIDTYTIYVTNTPFKMYFYNTSGSLEATNFLIIDSVNQTVFNVSSSSAIYIQKEFAVGDVRTIFNYDNTTYEQQYEYINDLTQDINEQMLILPNMNSVGFFKVTDIYGVEIEDASIKIQARHSDFPSIPLRTVNQKLSAVDGSANMYYELGNDIYYWISVSADGYDAYQNSIDLDNIENGQSDSPYEIRLEKTSNALNNGLGAYFDNEYTNNSAQIPIYFYTTKYSTIKFKTQYMIDRGIDWITIPENANLDNVHKYTMTQLIDYAGSGEDIALFVQADSEEFSYTIEYKGSTSQIFDDVQGSTNEWMPLIFFIGILMIIVGVRFTFKTDDMSVDTYFLSILILSLLTQTALFGYIALVLIGIYYLTKGFKKVSENAE